MELFVVGLAIAVLILAFAWRRERGLRERSRLLGEILDRADTLERELLECRRRLRELEPLVPAGRRHSTPNPAAAVEPQVQAALRDLLAHRLWIKEHAANARLDELRAAHTALGHARDTLARQLASLTEAQTDLDRAWASLPRPTTGATQ